MKMRLFTSVLMATAVIAVVAGQPAFGARKALMAGVEEYATPEYNLKGVREDVRLLKESLVQKKLFSEQDIKILLDKDATRANILKAFKDWLVNGTAPGDTVLFYFSGHGVQLWGESGHKIQTGMDEAIMPHDARATENRIQRTFRGRTGVAFTLAGTENLILDQEIAELLRQLQGRTVVFVSDSCHSGTVYKRVSPHFVKYKTIGEPIRYKSVFEPRQADSLVSNTERGKPNMLGDVKLPADTRLICLTASEAAQPAEIVPFDKDPKGLHSVFTWYLLHALEGKADLNRDSKITFSELAKYLHEEVTRDGYAQIPQHEFKPKNLSDETFLTKADTRTGTPERPSGALERPSRITCALKIDGTISRADKESILSVLKRTGLPIEWTEDQSAAVCLIDVQKSGGNFGARLTDATGSYWETHSGPGLEKVIEGVLKNLRAYYVQLSIAALRNSGTKMAVDLDYKVKSPAPRSPGEVVKGDHMTFQAKAETPGYLSLLSVDCNGVIHPLYPEPNAEARKLNAKEAVTIGEGGGLSLSVQPPFGKEVIFAFLTSRPMESLKSYWAKDDVGDPTTAQITEQARFLDALWNELVASGKPREDWTSRLWSVQSFESAR